MTKYEKVRAGMTKIGEAITVAEYLDRYYKPNRYKGRGEEYEKVLLKSYTKEFEENGWCGTSRHDNVVGVWIELRSDGVYVNYIKGRYE